MSNSSCSLGGQVAADQLNLSDSQSQVFSSFKLSKGSSYRLQSFSALNAPDELQLC
jgi:hypothetical protein